MFTGNLNEVKNKTVTGTISWKKGSSTKTMVKNYESEQLQGMNFTLNVPEVDYTSQNGETSEDLRATFEDDIFGFHVMRQDGHLTGYVLFSAAISPYCSVKCSDQPFFGIDSLLFLGESDNVSDTENEIVFRNFYLIGISSLSRPSLYLPSIQVSFSPSGSIIYRVTEIDRVTENRTHTSYEISVQNALSVEESLKTIFCSGICRTVPLPDSERPTLMQCDAKGRTAVGDVCGILSSDVETQGVQTMLSICEGMQDQDFDKDELSTMRKALSNFFTVLKVCNGKSVMLTTAESKVQTTNTAELSSSMRFTAHKISRATAKRSFTATKKSTEGSTTNTEKPTVSPTTKKSTKGSTRRTRKSTLSTGEPTAISIRSGTTREKDNFTQNVTRDVYITNPWDMRTSSKLQNSTSANSAIGASLSSSTLILSISIPLVALFFALIYVVYRCKHKELRSIRSESRVALNTSDSQDSDSVDMSHLNHFQLVNPTKRTRSNDRGAPRNLIYCPKGVSSSNKMSTKC